jgi:hypothetical protein
VDTESRIGCAGAAKQTHNNCETKNNANRLAFRRSAKMLQQPTIDLGSAATLEIKHRIDR